MQPQEAVADLKQRFESLLVNPPREVFAWELLADVINSAEFAELLEWIDDVIEEVTGEPFYTPDDAVMSLATFGDACAFVESVCQSRSRTA